MRASKLSEICKSSAQLRPRCPATFRLVHHAPNQPAVRPPPNPSAAAIWPLLRPFIAGEYRLGRFMARRRSTSALYEFIRFGLKQGWACLFGGFAVLLMIATWWFYPATAWLPRYDFLFLCMITVQVALLAGKLETSDEAKVILSITSSEPRWRSSKRLSAPGFTRRLVSSASAACRCSPASCMPASAAISAAPGACSISSSPVIRGASAWSRSASRSISTSSAITTWSTCAGSCLPGPAGCSSARASISGSGMTGVRCRCCSASGLCHSSSGSRKTSGHLQKSGSIRHSGLAGRWFPSTSSAPGSCC